MTELTRADEYVQRYGQPAPRLADLRTRYWFLLPRRWQLVCIALDEDGRITDESLTRQLRRAGAEDWR
jgi:hypothetical protein